MKSCSLLTECVNIATDQLLPSHHLHYNNFRPIHQNAWICLHCLSHTPTVGNMLAIQRLSPFLYLYWLMTLHSSLCVFPFAKTQPMLLWYELKLPCIIHEFMAHCFTFFKTLNFRTWNMVFGKFQFMTAYKVLPDAWPLPPERGHIQVLLFNLTLYAQCIILQYVYEPTRRTKNSCD